MNNTFRLLLASICLVTLSSTIHAQSDDLDKLMDDSDKKQKVLIHNAFKSPRVINGHSMEMLAKGVLDFRILHRFGMIKDGYHEWFGLDQASMRMGFDYGVSRNLTIGVGRSTFNKEVDGFFKYRMLQQQKGLHVIPVSLIWVSGSVFNTNKIIDPRLNEAANRLSYYHQLIIGRKFSNQFTLQLSPTLVHRNLVELPSDKNNMYALGVGARIKLSNRSAFILDTYPILYGARSGYQQFPLSIGIDLETGGHVFQLHVTNARGMNEKAFITSTNDRWDKGQIRFGFNLSRVFTVVKNTTSNW